MSNLKKHFAYNIAVRKYFKKILPYSSHGRMNEYQAPLFLVQRKLVPVVKRAVELCRWHRVVVNGKAVSEKYLIQPYDLISFSIRKALLRFKQKRFFYRNYGGSKWGIMKGLIYNRRIRHYIVYKNSPFLTGNKRHKYLYYYYFHRNVLQGCRMR